jgi:tetratricopeptide (TPR) repeat protein
MNRRPLFLAIFLSLALGTGDAQSNQQLLDEGLGALRASDFTRAQQTFALLVKHDPSGTNFGYLAIAEASSGNVDEAIVHFQQAIRLGNSSPRIHYNLGIAYLQKHQSPAAIRELKQAVAKDPEFVPAQHALGVALVDLGQPKEAIPYFQSERSRSPKDPEVWANLVQAQLAAGLTEAALRSADEAVEAIPNNTRLTVLLANLCLDYQQPQKARYLLENASEFASQDNNIKLLLAKASLAAGEPVEALAVLKDLPPGAGKKSEVSFLRGVALGRVGNYQEAATQLSAAIAAEPENADYLITYAWLQQLEANYREALTTLDKARKLKTQSPVIPYASAVSYFLLNQDAEAVKSCEEAARLAPRYSPTYLLLGIVKMKQGDFHAAAAALRQGVALQPKMQFFHRELGVALFKTGELAQSKKELDEALSLDPKDARTYYWQAQLLEHNGQRQQAIADLETAVLLQPTLAVAYGKLAELYQAAGEAQKAEQALAKHHALSDTEADEDRGLFLQQLYHSLP